MLQPQDQHSLLLFFFNDTATTEIYTLSLHDALPISRRRIHRRRQPFTPCLLGLRRTSRKAKQPQARLAQDTSHAPILDQPKQLRSSLSLLRDVLGLFPFAPVPFQ